MNDLDTVWMKMAAQIKLAVFEESEWYKLEIVGSAW